MLLPLHFEELRRHKSASALYLSHIMEMVMEMVIVMVMLIHHSLS